MRRVKRLVVAVAIIMYAGMMTTYAGMSIWPSALDYDQNQTASGEVTWKNSPYVILASIKSNVRWASVKNISKSKGSATFDVEFSGPGYATITATFKLNPDYPDTPSSEVPGKCTADVKAVTVGFGHVSCNEDWGTCEVDGRFSTLVTTDSIGLPIAVFNYIPTKVDYKLPGTPCSVLVNSTPMPENVLVKLVDDIPLTCGPYGVVAAFADTTFSTQGKATVTLKGAMGKFVLEAFHVDTTAYAEFHSKSFYNKNFLYKPNLSKVAWVFKSNKRFLKANIKYAHKWADRWTNLARIVSGLALFDPTWGPASIYASEQSIAWGKVESTLRTNGPGGNAAILSESMAAINVLPRKG